MGYTIQDAMWEAAYMATLEDRARQLGLHGADIEEALDSIEHHRQAQNLTGRRLALAESDSAMAIAVVDTAIALPYDDEAESDEDDED